MEVRMDRKKRNKNKFDKITYTKIAAFAMVLVIVLYMKWFTTFSIRAGNGLKLFLMAIVMVAISWRMSIRYNRNVYNAFCIALLPVFLYDVMSMWPYDNVLKLIDVIGIPIIVILSAGFVYFEYSGRNRSKKRVSFYVERAAVIARTGCCLLLLMSVIIGKIHIRDQYSLWFSQILYNISDTQNDVYDYDNSLDANIEEVSKLDPLGGWHDLTLEEKAHVLETCVRIETRYYGLGTAPSLEIALLDNENLLGYFDLEENKIKLSYKYIVDTNADGYAVLKVICHEMYHVYQSHLVSLLNDIRNNENMKQYENLLLLYDAGVYENEMNNYHSGDEGKEYFMYSSQQLERDAERNANASVVEFYNRIQDFFNKS